MRFLAIITLTVVVSLAVPIGATPTATNSTGVDDVVDAINQSSSPSPTAQRSGPEYQERIDPNTVIVDAEYRANESVALITIRSRSSQTITLSDGGQFRQGGKVPVTVEPFRAGETATIEVSVTEVDGMVGVAISTENTRLYSEIIEDNTGGGLDILRTLSSVQAWLAGAAIAFVWMAVAGWSVMRREGGRPEVA